MADSENEKFYLRQLSKQEQNEFIEKMKQARGAEFKAWKKKESRVDTFMVLSPDKENENRIHLDEVNVKNHYYKTSFTNEVLFKIIIDEDQFFSNGKLEYDYEKNDYSIELNQDQNVYHGIRRSNFRIKTDQDNHISLTVNKKTYPCCDVSTGGTCFIVAEKESDKFKPDEFLNRSILKFNDKTYELPTLQIMCNIDFKEKNDENEPLRKIAVKFSELAETTEEAICRQINAEMKSLAIRQKTKDKKLK